MSRLDLLLPGLSGPRLAPPAKLKLPALERLLGAAQCETLSGADLPGGYVNTLCALFGLEPGQAPMAAISLLGEGGELAAEAGQGRWLRADALSLHAGQDKVYLLEAPPAELTRELYARVLSEIAPLYADEGWRFIAADEGRGYLQGPVLPPLAIGPAQPLLGADLFDHLPQGAEGAPWRSLLNELQMALHSTAANRARLADGLTPVNALWLWGGGSLDRLQTTRAWSRVCGDDPLLAGLAKLSNGALAPCPESGLPELAEETLWLDSRLAQAAIERSPAWFTQLEGADDELFAPLLGALRKGEIESLTLHDGCGRRYPIARRQLRRWWVRRRTVTWMLKP